MRNSYEVAKFIEKKLKETGMSNSEFARRIGVDRSTVTRYFNGLRKINMDEIPKIASVLNLDPMDLLIEDEELKELDNIIPITSDVVKVPILGEIACGSPIYVEENFEGYTYEFSDDLPAATLDRWYHNYLDQWVEKEGFTKEIKKEKRIRIHDFRHSHASYLINKGAIPAVVAKRLGHKDVATTLNTYSHLYPSTEKEIISQMEDDFKLADVIKLKTV